MVKTKSIVLLLIGLTVGFYAIKMGVHLVKKAQGANSAPGVKVVVARELVPVGVEISARMLKLTHVPESLAPEGCFHNIEELVGRVTTWSLQPGGYFSGDVLAPPGTVPGLSVKIPQGYRAVSVEVDEDSAVAGFLMPGNWVDVIAVMNCRRSNKRDTISRTILENVQVAAVGQEMSDPKDPGAKLTRSVTLLVKPKNAAALHLAATKGAIRLALRHRSDDGQGERGYATENSLFEGGWKPENDKAQETDESPNDWWRDLAGGLAARPGPRAAPKPAVRPTRVEPVPEPVVAQLAPPEPWKVTLFRGDQREELTFNPPDPGRALGRLNSGNHRLLNFQAGKGRYSDVSDQTDDDLEDGSDKPEREDFQDD